MRRHGPVIAHCTDSEDFRYTVSSTESQYRDVNETLRYETETSDFKSKQDENFRNFLETQDKTETFDFVSESKSETETFKS